MHLDSKKMAFLGLLMAITEVLIILSGILDFNTLFLLAAASFCVGIAFRESSIRVAVGFGGASFLLGFLLAPNKFYCITFGAMSIYLLAIEYSYDKLIKLQNPRKQRNILWVLKYVIFNIMYIPAVVFLPKLIYSGDLNGGFLLWVIVIGQAVLYIYDRAYAYFQGYVWGKLRKHLKL